MYKSKLEANIAEAMKTKDKVGLSVWRDIKNEFLVFEKAKSGNHLDDASEIKIISKMVSARKESAKIYEDAGRDELAENERKELEFLQNLLPKEPTEEELEAAVDEILSGIESPSMKNMKDVIAGVRSKYPTSNGGTVSKIFRNKIN